MKTRRKKAKQKKEGRRKERESKIACMLAYAYLHACICLERGRDGVCGCHGPDMYLWVERLSSFPEGLSKRSCVHS